MKQLVSIKRGYCEECKDVRRIKKDTVKVIHKAWKGSITFECGHTLTIDEPISHL